MGGVVDHGLNLRQRALLQLGQELRRQEYRFVAPTPETHRRVNARPGNQQARTLRDVFGWSRPFSAGLLPAALFDLGQRAEILVPLEGDGSRWTSTVRYATLSNSDGDQLYVHSAFPTAATDAVFFGPDSYRFAALLCRAVKRARRVVDIGCGTGVGALTLAGRVDRMVLADTNPQALQLAAVNVALAGIDPDRVTLVVSDVLKQVNGEIDLIISNPPYLVDAPGRLYRDGGGPHGVDLSARIIDEAVDRLSPGGQLILYTGVPIVDGRNVLADDLPPWGAGRVQSWTWEELDPDVFGEELLGAAYQQTERLAVVALTVTVR